MSLALARILRIRRAGPGLMLALALILWGPTAHAAASTDTDGDGLPNTWETNNGLNPNDNGSINPINGAAGDPDNDGLPNDEEYLLGSNPWSNESGKSWTARPAKADLLMVSAHPDDEGIFFGGAIPYYTRVQRRAVVLISMTSGDYARLPTVREAELRNAVWSYGLRNQPMFPRFKDNATATLNDTWDLWADGTIDGDDVAEGRQKAVAYVATRIRRYRPDVVMTHGFNGEYGHQNHVATAVAVTDAIAVAADPSVALGGLPAWQVKKVYVHEYGVRRLFHDFWETAFPELNGQTPRAAANTGLTFHVTQGLPSVSTAYLTGEVSASGDAHPSEWWGLYSTTVGSDPIAPDFTIAGTTYSGWARGDFFGQTNASSATVTLGGLAQTYNGSPRSATATTSPSGLAVTITYNGSTTAPTNAGSYTVVGTVSNASYSGSATGTLVIAKAATAVTLGGLAQTFNGSPRSVTATTSPGGLPVTFTYNGSATAPANAASYTVVGTVSDPNYSGSATGTLVVAKAAATVTLGALAQTYNGSPRSATATTSPGGLAVVLTYNGSGTAPSNAGSYTVVGTINHGNYAGSATGSLVIAKATATVTLANTAQVFDSTPKSVTVSTTPAGLGVAVTYGGSSTPPSAIGSYAVVATINDANATGSATGTLTITKNSATVTLGNLSQTYNGSPRTAAATTSPGGLVVALTYNGSATAPTNAGSYTVVGTISDANYSGSASSTLVIAKAPATVTLGGLSQTYNGSPKSATATTSPSGLTATFTYNSSSTAPTESGSYAVVGTISDANYSGSASSTLVIARAPATVALGGLAQVYNGSARSATATTSPGGLAVAFTYNGSSTAPTNAGSYAVVGTIGNTNYTGSVSGTLVVTKATATVTLGGLAQTYNGSARSATATTSPGSLAVTFTYDGSPNAPNNAGSYAVVGAISDTNFQASANGTLVVSKATAPITFSNTSQAFDGTPKSVTASTTPSGLALDITYGGANTAPTAMGSYPVVATINDANHVGSASGTLTITKANATVTLGGLAQTYNGTPRTVSATTNPAGLLVNITYNGSTTTPISAGSYTAVATISDANYAGSASDTLVIAKASATVTLGDFAHTYTGNAKSVTATTSPGGLAVTLTYDGSPTAPTNAGSYAVGGTINDANYSGSASGTLVVAKATATVTVSSLAQTYNGAPRSASGTTSPGGLAVTFSYNGSATAPTNAGAYAVVGSINDTNYQGSATGTLVVAQATATITLSNTAQAFDGTPKPVTASTTPAGLTLDITYGGSATAPTAIGSYPVVATINDLNHAGSTTGTLAITTGTATVTLHDLTQIYDGSPRTASASTNPEGMTVNFTYDGKVTPPTGAGRYAVVGTVSDPNYQGAATGTLVVGKGTATIALADTSQTFDGTPKPITASTTPAGLALDVTYGGLATAPSAAGSYPVVATINDANRTGSTTGTLTIASTGASVTLGNLTQTYDGSPHAASATTNPAGLSVSLTYDGSMTPPTSAGSYTVVGTISDTNYSGSASGTLVVAKAVAMVTLSNTTQTYDGSPKSVIATTTPAGLNVIATYAGGGAAPSAVGAYAVTAIIDDPNHTGSADGVLEILAAVLPNQPESIHVVAGGTTTLSVTAAAGSNITFQWQLERPAAAPAAVGSGATTWVDIPDATGSSYTIRCAQRSDAGRYRVLVSANGVSTASIPVSVALDAPPPNNARLLNLSTRGLAQSGANVLIPGFVVQGVANKKLLIRAIGPTLEAPPIMFGGGAIPDPAMFLKRYNSTTNTYEDYAANDDWQTNANVADIMTVSAALGAFELRDARDAALLVDLPAGQYSVIAGDQNGTTGIAIVELYDADSDGSDARLINISNRGYAGVGEQAIIPGFVVSPEGPKTLLVRVVGPTLAANYGVPGTMADPGLAIYRRNVLTNDDDLLFRQDNWSDHPDAAYTAQIAQQVSAFALNQGSKDAALVVTLEPGVYTVVGSSADGVGTGVVLAEVYVVP